MGAEWNNITIKCQVPSSILERKDQQINNKTTELRLDLFRLDIIAGKRPCHKDSISEQTAASHATADRNIPDHPRVQKPKRAKPS